MTAVVQNAYLTGSSGVSVARAVVKEISQSEVVVLGIGNLY